ncbi:MAG: recombinase zinc beta ribbon domain-containing protein [Anaerostipes hadrus]|nr:recombinase zinc beta ribbon domain-containing protein [Anaerostipes hadrus]
MKRAKVSTDSNRVIIRRQYAFSCMLQCYFCGSNLSRRTWHSSSKYSKVIWQCVKSAKKGKRFCPESKAIPEAVIEKAFVESYKILCENNQDILEDLLDKIEMILKDEKIEKEVKQIEGRIKRTKTKRNKLADGYLDGIIPKDVYEKKEEILKSTLLKDCNELQYLKKELDGKDTLSDRINNFRNTLKNNQILEEFDRHVFESIIEKVIIGGIDKDGNKDPYMITFIYKTGLEHEIKDAKKNCDQGVRNEKEKNADVHSFDENEIDSVHSLSGNDTYREYRVDTKDQYLKILVSMSDQL